MNSRILTFLSRCFALALLLVSLGHRSVAAEDVASKPHIVFVLTDDLSPGDVGCYGGKFAQTPNIDRLAHEGTRFTRYYSAAPICSPSRAGLITGQFPARWRITSYLQTRAGNRGCEQVDFLDASAPSLPRALKNAGYATAHIGKWHLGGGRDVTDAPKFAAYGYDEGVGTYESPEPHPEITATNWVWSARDKVKRWNRSAFFVDRTLDFIARHKDQPCFVNLWLDDPHTPWVPEPKEGDELSQGNTRAKLVRVLEEKWGFDIAYNWFASRMVVGGSRSVLWRGVDTALIDGAVNGAASVVGGLAQVTRTIQSGLVRGYALVILGGAVVVVGYLLWRP